MRNGDGHQTLALRDEFFREHGRYSSGENLHYCYEWDGMAIDSTCKEFECCICFRSSGGTK